MREQNLQLFSTHLLDVSLLVWVFIEAEVFTVEMVVMMMRVFSCLLDVVGNDIRRRIPKICFEFCATFVQRHSVTEGFYKGIGPSER